MAGLRQAPAIDAYGDDGFRVDGRWRPGPLLILEDAPRPWPVGDAAALAPTDLGEVLAAGPGVEVVLLGLGRALRPPPRALREAFRDAGQGLEVLTTPEACRLYNLLAQEGRRVAAALLPLGASGS